MRETIEKQDVRIIQKDMLLAEADHYYADGYRLVHILALNAPEGFELNYSFGKDFVMTTLRFTVGVGEPVPSITHIWRGAYLYENEIHDLYGVPIENLSVNYGGRFYDVAKPHPFAAVKRPESEA